MVRGVRVRLPCYLELARAGSKLGTSVVSAEAS